MKKPSFLSRITGQADDQYDENYFGSPVSGQQSSFDHEERGTRVAGGGRQKEWTPEEPQGELAVDIYQTPDTIVVKALVAGVQPGSIDISLTREMLTISGTREEEREVEEENYFQRELYWGSFSRTIILPEEIDVDMAEASEKHGILMIRLPKINKKRETKLKVRSR
jgi:HSP20 family protein